MTHYFPDLGDDEPYYSRPNYDGSYNLPVVDDDMSIEQLREEQLLEDEENYHRENDYHYYLNID